jgi:hypothetical protein
MIGVIHNSAVGPSGSTSPLSSEKEEEEWSVTRRATVGSPASELSNKKYHIVIQCGDIKCYRNVEYI